MREQDVETAERLAGRRALEERGIQIWRGGVECEQRRRIDVDRFEKGGDSSVQHQSRARKISEPFVPPNPNEFDSATRIGMRRATFGT
jgi:hypothetical protein